MKKISTANLFKLLLIASFSLITFQCSENPEDITGTGGGGNNNGQTGKVKIEGTVINNLTGYPIIGAAVLLTGLTQNLSTTTNTTGKYSFEFIVEGNVNLKLIFNKEEFFPDTLLVLAQPNKNLTLPFLELYPRNPGNLASGDPVSIFLLSQSTDKIGVKESGDEETARLVFVVQDSAGIPIDLAHSVDVKFRFGARPGGGEILSPAIVRTNNNGTAAVNLTSGTKSGVVQIIAEVFLPDKIITSIPVAISIHGGLPNYNHLSVGPAAFNFPGLRVHGLTNPISVIVGDKYSNPVKPNTAVYFSTTGGIIEGSTLTDLQGRGTVDLISGNPIPNHPLLGPGFATITATTADENLQNISRNTIVLFSGSPFITVSPATFDVPNNGSQTFYFTVKDENDNPIAPGNTIKVTVEGEDIKSQGDINVIMPDTQSRTWTQFTFTLYDNDPEDFLRPVSVKIETTGPNGGTFLTFNGTAR
jgi:hypothetical protein